MWIFRIRVTHLMASLPTTRPPRSCPQPYASSSSFCLLAGWLLPPQLRELAWAVAAERDAWADASVEERGCLERSSVASS